ncbi:MAG: radical SAM protein [Candidatus Nealsonbacteria bacterium]|nr:radical SAM protein [Candidatus Nealsonbacteria bacterium]
MNRIYPAFKKHILINILERNFSKPWHFIKANIKYRLFGHPYAALIEVGNYCNLRCPTCPTPAGKICRKRELMSFDNFKKVIDNIKDSVQVVLLYFTNEPLLNPDISRMAGYAHQNGLYTEISTNAVLLNREMTNDLFRSKLDRIILDLDGTSKESYEQFRVGANFEQVLGNITYFCRQKQALKLRRPFIELQFVFNKLNQNELEDVKKIAKDLKVDRLSIRSFNLGEYAYSEKEREELSRKFFPDKSENDRSVRYKKEDGKLKIKNPPDKCPLAKSHLVVLADGSVSMCCYDLNGRYFYGNVLSQKLKDIWFDPVVRERRKIAQKRGYPLCKTCSIYESKN